MSLPPALESEFELVEELPAGKVFQCYHVKERKAKRARELLLRLLPTSLNNDKTVIDEFHGFFLKLSNLTNRSHIPIVYSVSGTIGGPVYVLEQYVSAVSLPEYIESHLGSRTLIDDLTEVVARVCEALHFAHQKDIFHCCITPDDILIDPDNPRKVKLIGFGAQILFKTNNLRSMPASLPKMVAPEISSGTAINPRGDIYSLAVTLSEACPEISLWRDLLARCQLKDPMQRPASARAFGRELRKFADTTNERVVANESGDLISGGLNPVLTIKTEPTGAEVWANGNTLGVTTASGLMVPWKPGTFLEIKKPGYSTKTLDLTAPPANTDITVALTSSLTLYTNPWGASVRVNGVEVGVTSRDGLAVPWQRSTIEIQKPGFKSESLKFATVPLEQEKYIELETVASSVVPKRHWLELVGYVLGAIVLWLLPLVIYSATVNRSGLEKDIGDKDIEIARLTQAEKALRIDFDKQASDFRSQVKTKDAEIERLAQSEKSFTIDFQKQLGDLRSQVKTKDTEIVRISEAEKNLKIDVEKQVVGLRSDLNRKDAEITKLTQLDQEKTKLQSELQKQLNDLKSTVLIKDKDITRLSQVERENQQLQAQLKSLKQSQSQPPQSPMAPSLPSAKTSNDNLDMELISAAKIGNTFQVSRLLNLGAKPNKKNSDGDTALMLASYYGRFEIVETLLKAGADKNLRDSKGMTALDLAKQRNHSNIVSLLNAKTGWQTPLSPTTKTVNHYLDPELISAASSHDDVRLRAVLTQGANPNARNSEGHTALMKASMNGHLEVVKTLLKHGADKNLKSPSGNTALDYSKLYNNTSLFDYLR